MLISTPRLRQLLGMLWLLDGLLQLQPQMFTMNMVNGTLLPNIQAQPSLIAANLTWMTHLVSQNLLVLNWLIALIQIGIGLCLLLNVRTRTVLLGSVLWSLLVWYGGEGMSLLLTGHASALTGAPGSVIFYALLALVLLPRHAVRKASGTEIPAHIAHAGNDEPVGVLSRASLRWVLAAFWLLAALLQGQSYWWQSGQISQVIDGLASPGTLSGAVLDPSLHWLAGITSSLEIPLNFVLIVVFLILAVGLVLFDTRTSLRIFLSLSMLTSLLLWWTTQAFGMVLTGMSTDPNSGPLLILLALACWPVRSYALADTAAVTTTRDSTSMVRWGIGVLAVIVLGVSSLTAYADAHHATTSSVSSAPPTPSITLVTGKTSDAQLAVTLAVSPNQVGQNSFTVHITEANGTPQTQDTVSLETMMLSMDMGTQVMPMQSDEMGNYKAVGTIGMSGTLQVRVVIHTPNHTLHVATMMVSSKT